MRHNLGNDTTVARLRMTILLLTNDPAFECAAHSAAKSSGYCLIVGRDPGDAARLLAENLSCTSAAVIDLDDCVHGSAWLTALAALSRKIPALAVSGLDSRFLRPLAQRHGVEHWISKPADVELLAQIFQETLCPSEPI